MISGRSEAGGVVRGVVFWLSAGLAALVAGFSIWSVTTIGDLLTKSRYLRQAITNLTKEDQIGYAKVLTQWKDDQKGRLITRLLFVETDRNDKSKQVLRKEYEIDGDVVHFDALVVKFGNRVVTDGTERALYIWRRIYGEYMPPVEGFPIEAEGEEPHRYAGLMQKLDMRDIKTFWSEIWNLSNNPDALKEFTVTSIEGKVVYKQLRPGFIYVMKIDSGGNLFSEVIPDLSPPEPPKP